MANNAIHILCTAPVKKQDLSGVQIDVVTFISVAPIVNDALAKQVAELHTQAINVVFTSANAVTAVSGDVKHKTDWSIYCIGNATKDAVVKCYGRQAVKDTALNGSQLADKILKHKDVKEVVFFCGNHRRLELINKLRANKVAVKEVVVYETTFTPQKIAQQYNAILFFSPTAVQSFFSVNKIDAEITLFAIGETTADALRCVACNTIVIADTPDKQQLLNEAIAHCRASQNV